MTEIRPFQAVFYNKDKIKDVSKVICPPYDVISPQYQDNLYNASPHNFVRVYLGKEKSSDTRLDNRYTRAKRLYDQWLKEGILVQDDKPCIYFYRQEYKMLGQKYSRLGFISLMKLPDEKTSKIYPHENTHAKAKEDRLRLWRILRSNLSAIFVCFSDQEKKVEKVFLKHVGNTKPFMDVVDDDKVRHVIWRVEDPEQTRVIVNTLADQQLFIADGHHRFEVAKDYRRLKMGKAEKHTGSEPYNFVLTYFTNIDSKDLKIFPIHRVIRKVPGKLDFLEELFRIDKVKTKSDLTILLAKAGQNEHAFGMYAKDGIRLLRLKNKSLIDQYVTEGSPEYRRLDATILKYFVLDRWGVKSEDIFYTKDMNEAYSMVHDGQAEASFIMNPVKIQQLKSIALNGEKMPPKTTYFYPKVLSGLTVYKME